MSELEKSGILLGRFRDKLVTIAENVAETVTMLLNNRSDFQNLPPFQ